MKIRALKGRAQITSAFRRGKKFASDSLIVHCRTRKHANESDAPEGGNQDIFIICAVRKKFMTLAFVWQKPMKHHLEAQTTEIKPQVEEVLNQAMQYFSGKQEMKP